MKKITIALSLAGLIFFTLSCGPQKQDNSNETVAEKEASPKHNYPETLAKALEAHGGIDKWNSFGTLQYDLENSMLDSTEMENQLIDLWSRKVLLSTSKYKIGFDGKEVWVSPNKAAFGKMPPRFYHNLVFYFFGIPFLLSDPGINYEELGSVTVAGKTYDALKVSYGSGIGDSPEDVYIAHFNPETHQLELVLYTVTYFTGEKVEKYNALVYDEWQEANGLIVPKSMKGYKYENDSLKELRYAEVFNNVEFKAEAPNTEIFAMPANAEIDSLKK